MTLEPLLLSNWDWEPSVLAGCAALLIAYFSVLRFRLGKEASLFTMGVLLLFLALVSPLDTLADQYLFSAHMLQHLIMVLAVPVFLLLGIPELAAVRVLKHRFAQCFEHVIGRPAVAWSLGMGTFWIWHAPSLYDAALRNEWLHIVEHLCFLVTAVIFWWPVLTPIKQKRLTPPLVFLYLMPAGVANTFLGILLAFFPSILYPAYLHAADPNGILHLIRNTWNISARSDQQLGGLLMWIPGSLVYVGVIFTVLVRWFAGAPPQRRQ